MSGEFALIDRYFGLRAGLALSQQVPLGIGDDCAALSLPSGHVLLTSVDTSTEGVHFFAGTDPVSVGHKALAVNLSDLAACGAQPLACLMALSLPLAITEDWVAGFARGFLELAERFNCPLVGGDTTRSGSGGGVSVSVTVMGHVPDQSSILRRSGAQVGDDIWVSGRLGAAALAVALRKAGAGGGASDRADSAQLAKASMASMDAALAAVTESSTAFAFRALDWPQPRVELGLALRGVASACIDLSDGLLADLGHMLHASAKAAGHASAGTPADVSGAELDSDCLPLAAVLDDLPDMGIRCEFALSGGDDYELCFTASANRRDTVQMLGASLGLELIRIGTVRKEPGIVLVGKRRGEFELPEKRGYEHF